jgi:hypothetical protein
VLHSTSCFDLVVCRSVKSLARSSIGFPTGDCSRVSWSRSRFYCRFPNPLLVSVHLLPACFFSSADWDFLWLKSFSCLRFCCSLPRSLLFACSRARLTGAGFSAKSSDGGVQLPVSSSIFFQHRVRSCVALLLVPILAC